MNIFEKSYKMSISSDKLGRQIWGAIIKHWLLTLLFVIFSVLSVLSLVLHFLPFPFNKIIYVLCLSLFLVDVIRICNTLTDINSLLRKENRITWSQIWKLIALGIWLAGVIFILGIQKETKSSAALGLISGILALIFQEKIKGAVAFIHLRIHHLLNIGDWIQVPKYNADGEVKSVTLSTLTLSNWDNTISTIPIAALQSENFKNLQNMSDGKTYGRRMLKNFTINTNCFHPTTKEEVKLYTSEDSPIARFIPKEEVKEGVLNAHLYRLYLYHWLMWNPVISQRPNLMVRWIDANDSGMELQVYAFITDSSLAAFEWQQSQIIEHIVTSMGWFGLRLFQSPSAYDISKSEIHIDNPDIIIKEDKK